MKYVSKKPLLIGQSVEKPIIKYTWLDNFGFTLFSLISYCWRRFRFKDNDLANRVISYSNTLSSLEDHELDQRVKLCKIELRTQRLSDDQLVTTFGLIREISGRVLGMRHHPTQIRASVALLRGQIAEMATGEGKTLAATLAAATSAMMGVPVHVVTVNDYLTERDGEEMGVLYKNLGLTVGIVKHEMEIMDRRAAYHCDITYCSNKELVFDYLKDRIYRGSDQTVASFQRSVSVKQKQVQRLMQRGCHFAIVDEADSIFIDEARTPLIISGNESFGAHEEELIRVAMSIAGNLAEGKHFVLHDTSHITLTTLGEDRCKQLAIPHGGLWLSVDYRQSLVTQALTAYHVYEKNKHYIVNDEDEIQIVDAYTGRVTPGRSWGQGLHQMIELKESLEFTKPRQTVAEISYQNFFRKYFHVAGMTGTCYEVRHELRKVFRVNYAKIPLLKKSQRRRTCVTVDVTLDSKYQRVVNFVANLHRKGQPVLVGTSTVSASETLAKAFHAEGLSCKVLNARQDKEEAKVVKDAGKAGAITIATGIAGRGTDIKLTDEAKQSGGLHVVITELQDSARIDRQFYGRSARQGDPGSYSLMLSLEDDIISRVLQPGLRRVLVTIASLPGLRYLFAYGLIKLCQLRLQHLHYKQRMRLLSSDIKRQRMLSFSGKSEYES